MRTPRFSLRFLLLLMTGFVLALGYPLYWRTKIRTLCAELHADGHVFSVPNEWRDYLWQRPPVVGTLAYENRSQVVVTWAMHPTRKRVETRIISDGATIERLKKLGMVEYE
jgi:hypothetical protein